MTIVSATGLMAQGGDNPANLYLKPFNTVHGTPPFKSLKTSDVMPAIEQGIAKANAEIKAITDNKAKPDFENTIVALDIVGRDLDRVLGVFYALLSADADEDMMALSMDASAKLSDYSTSIILNEDLWKRIKQVYDTTDKSKMTPEDSMLLQTTYDSFALAGANLQGDDRETFRNLSAELSKLTTAFGQNVLKELNTYQIYLNADEVAGIPENTLAAAAEAAKAAGKEGQYLFGLDQPTYMAVMRYADNRAVREKFNRLYTSRNTSGEFSNMENIRKISETRLKLANLLGSDTYARHGLKRTMAQNPEAVYNILDQLREAYTPAMKKEMEELTAFARKSQGEDFTLMPWDYSYFSNKLKAEKYAYDEEAFRPYFELDNVIKGVFGLATRLYGLNFTENPDIEVYHPDVKAFEVTDRDGKYVGVLYTDFFPRETKRPGAWMTNFKEQWTEADGTDSRPHVTIVMNFTKPAAGKPSLLTPYEVETFLHEFGHALHGLFASGKYKSLSGTNVYRDFVELPSQFNENYLTEKEFLDTFARDYRTGEALPDSLLKSFIASSQYGAAYACLRQLMFGYLDMAWHTINAPVDDPVAFEREAVKSVAMFPDVDGTMTSTQFSHIFSGGYAAGYYSYKWAEVLDADAFAAFKENGIFDPATAESFKTNILMKGGSEDPAELYRKFRGRNPDIKALLIRDGIIESPAIDTKAKNGK